MRQRGAIARAFVTDPGMLLMDEPFAALDAQNRVILQAELVRIWEETGKTVVYITHSIEEALLLGDRTVVMTAQPGRIKEIIDIPVPASAQRHGIVGDGRVRRPQARDLAHPGGRGDAGAGGDRGMKWQAGQRKCRSGSSIWSRRSGCWRCGKSCWRLGFGDRRFVPAPSDIAVRFWQLTAERRARGAHRRRRCGGCSPASSSARCRRSRSGS